jgi:peptidoglycan/xylan/chitin deacetylase (PgdA/CDA1 family)
MRERVYTPVLRTAGAAAALTHLLGATVFCFHSVTDDRAPADATTSLSVSAGFIRRLVTRLRDLGIAIISLDEAIARRERGDRRPFAALTFDDGYADNAQVLHPLMEALDAPYAIFVTTGLIDGSMPLWWDSLERLVRDSPAIMIDGASIALPAERKAAVHDELVAQFRALSAYGQRARFEQLQHANPRLATYRPYASCLDWSAVRALHRSPLVTIGAHTRTHPMLSRCDAATLQDELIAVRGEIAERIGAPVDYLAYPFGQPDEYGPLAPDVAARAGYRAAFTTVHGAWSRARDPFTLPRVLIANKARHADVALAYMSPVPRAIKRWLRGTA